MTFWLQIGRAAHYAPRYRHLDSSFHNYLRITRILKCLGELGFEHYKWPFLRVRLARARVCVFVCLQLLNRCGLLAEKCSLS